MDANMVLTRNPIYDDDGSEVLISKSTWPLKLSGILFAGLLVVGRSASYGSITWSPAYHAPGAPLVVIHKEAPTPPAPELPKSAPSNDPAAMGKRMAAEEVVTFSPGGNAADGTQGSAHTAQETAQETAGEATGQQSASAKAPTAKSAHTAQETAQETAGEQTGAAESTAAATTKPSAATTQAETTVAATTKPGEQTTAVTQVETTVAAPAPAPAQPAAAVKKLAPTGQPPQPPRAAEGALGAVLTLMGIALLKPRNFLRKLIR